MNVIAFDQHWGKYEYIAVLNPGVTPADVIEWITTQGPYEDYEGCEYDPCTEQPQLWGELYELITTHEPGKYSYPDDDTYIGERYRFTDKKGVTHLLFKQPKLWFYFDYDEASPWVRYGKAYFYPPECEE